MSNYDKSILDQQHILDSREPEPIEWVYMVVEQKSDLAHSTTDKDDALQYFHDVTEAYDIDIYDASVTIELCKVDRELFSHKDWQAAYKQSEIIETKTL